MKIKKFKNRSTIHAFTAIAIVVLIVVAAQKCNAQMTIPLVKGTVEEGNIYSQDEDGGVVPQDPFQLYKSTMEATTTDVVIDFRRLKYERPNNLTYPIDSIDISDSMQDGYEKITLWTAVEFSLDQAEKIIIFANGITYRMYIYYPEEIFYFSGKVH